MSAGSATNSDVSSVEFVAQNEEEAREALLRSNYKKVAGITRVTVRRTDNQILIIERPDVYKQPGNGTYIVFGEPKVDNFTQKLALAQQQARQSLLFPGDEDDADDSEFPREDVDLVMRETDASEEKAIETLRAQGGDIVNSIFALAT